MHKDIIPAPILRPKIFFKIKHENGTSRRYERRDVVVVVVVVAVALEGQSTLKG